jgi:hypothetical protein
MVHSMLKSPLFFPTTRWLEVWSAPAVPGFPLSALITGLSPGKKNSTGQ